MQNTPKKILVVDDEIKIVEVLKAYLENSGYLVLEAYDGKTALTLIETTSPALVILDLMLPDITGEEICNTIRKKSKLPIIMLTAKVEEHHLLNGLNMGADDYISKPFSPSEVVARVAAVLRRTETVHVVEKSSIFQNNYLFIDYKNHMVKANDIVVDITPTEFKILATLSQSPNRAFTRDQLIEYALNGEFFGYDRTIDTYIKTLRHKLEPEPKKPRFILTVHGVGYRFGGE